MTAAMLALALTAGSVGATSQVNYVATISDGIQYPARLAAAPGGGFYVTDPPMKNVVAYDAGGDVVATYPIAQGPVGIAVHNDGRVFISREDGVIGVYSSALTLLGTVNPAPMALTGPNDLAWDATAAELYTVDSGSHRVLVFAETGGNWLLARSWGVEGSGMGQLAAPQAIAVDDVLGHVIVTDADNFRVQVFNTAGVLLFKFGYRVLYTTSAETAWFARAEGLAVDDCGNIYITDALMGTVRVFSATGAELSGTHAPAIGYGAGAGQLSLPCDVMIDGAGVLYVANTNNGSVEVFDVTCAVTAAVAANETTRGGKIKVDRGLMADLEAGRLMVPPDSPLEVIAALDAGEYSAELDLDRNMQLDEADIEIAIQMFGAGTVEDFSNVASHPDISEPHILDMPNRCSRCHNMNGTPGGMLTSAGQENLCLSCHSAGKIAGEASVPGGHLGISHPWGVPADDADPGPALGSEVSQHLDAGKVRCATCHEPHEATAGECVVPSPIPNSGFLPHIGTCVGGSANGEPCQKDSQCNVNFMRAATKVELCAECHIQYDEWMLAGHSHQHSDPWGHYDWSMGNNWLCTGPGTPMPYCTGEGVGTAASAGAAACISAGNPLACCTGPGTGNCTVANASCTGVGAPWACCSGVGTGNCANNLSAAACTGAGTPMACCTGVGTGSCSSREACRQCHSGNGYIDFAVDFPDNVVNTATHRGAFRVVDCLVCHATHGASEDESLLRVYDTVRLPTGQMLSGLAAGATCVSCHNGRAAPPVPNPAGVSTPHYLNGGAMLEGINGVAKFPAGNGPNAACTAAATPWSCCTGAGTGTCVGPTSACTGAGTPWACCTGAGTGNCPTLYVLSNSNHTTNAGLDCTTCHMGPVPESGPGAGKVGGHTFAVRVNDPDDPDYGFENVDNTCAAAACHPGLTTFNRTANGDYDGDGLTEGVQDETRGLMKTLKNALYVAGASRLLTDEETGEQAYDEEICTAAGVPLACCTGPQTGPACEDPHAHGANPYWTTSRCNGGTRAGLPCTGTSAPWNCPGGTCTAAVPSGDRLATVEDGIWNWEFVDNSEDLGVKNTGYAIGLLQIAYKGVTGNAVPGAAYRYSPAP